MSPPSAITVLTHGQPADTHGAVRRLLQVSAGAGVEVHLPLEEAEKHDIEPHPGVVVGIEAPGNVDLAVVLGGDGTILKALRLVTGRQIPVFAFNFGAIGFLSTVDHGQIEDGLKRAMSGDFDVIALPALSVVADGQRRLAVNDISFHRRPGKRVAELAYSVEGEQLGRVRCDGLVASTPVGSTGYNLANGGPVLAWGVEGFVVSFIAPHTLTARSLVVAPDHTLRVLNLSDRDEVDVTTDGHTVCALACRAHLDLRFEDDQALLAQLPGATFYHRLREKFGRLAN